MKKLFLVVLIGCGGGSMGDDDSGQPDSSKPDTSVMDSGKPDTGKDAGMDATMMDVASDAPDDSPSDAPIGDVVAPDGGILGIPGVVLWLDAAKGITKNNQNQVSKWADQSGNANDAAQGTSSLQPVFNATVINNLPALHFTSSNSGNQLLITDSQTLQWGTGDWLVEIVARFDNTPSMNPNGTGGWYVKPGMSSGVVFVGNALDPQQMTVSAGITGAIGPNDFVFTKSAYNDNAARNYAFRRAGQSLELRVGGMSVTSKNQSGNVDVSAANVNVAIGQYMSSSLLNGDIAEMIAVKGSISNNNLAALELYLKTKYNL